MTLYPNSSALIIAGVIQTALAAAKLCLYKESAVPIGPGTKLTDLTEADYPGYAEKTITTWNAPYLDPVGGATIQSGTQQFDFVPGVGDANVIKGFFVKNADGDLIVVGSFEESIPMAAEGDAIPVNVALNWCAVPI